MVLSVEQVCEMLGCKRTKVFELLGNGTLERAPRYGRQIRIYKDSVEKALARPEPKRGRKKRRPTFDVPPLIRPEDTASALL